MAKLKLIDEMYLQFCHHSDYKPAVAKLLTIYIQEASNGCGINSVKPVTDFHRTIADRIAAAKRYRAEATSSGDIVCDAFENGTLSTYQAFPDRMLIIMNGAVVHIGGPPDVFGLHYNVDSVFDWLNERYPGRTSLDSVSTVNTEEVEGEEECSA